MFPQVTDSPPPQRKITGLPKDGMENKIRTNQFTSKGQNSGLAIKDGNEDPNLILCKYIQLYLEYIV